MGRTLFLPWVYQHPFSQRKATLLQLSVQQRCWIWCFIYYHLLWNNYSQAVAEVIGSDRSTRQILKSTNHFLCPSHTFKTIVLKEAILWWKQYWRTPIKHDELAQLVGISRTTKSRGLFQETNEELPCALLIWNMQRTHARQLIQQSPT